MDKTFDGFLSPLMRKRSLSQPTGYVGDASIEDGEPDTSMMDDVSSVYGDGAGAIPNVTMPMNSVEEPEKEQISNDMTNWLRTQFPDMSADAESSHQEKDQGDHGNTGQSSHENGPDDSDYRASLLGHKSHGDYFAARLQGQRQRWPDDLKKQFAWKYFTPNEPPSFDEKQRYASHTHVLALNKMQPIVYSTKDPASFGFLRGLHASTRDTLITANVLALHPLQKQSAWFKLRVSVQGPIGIDICHLNTSYRTPLWASRNIPLEDVERAETCPENGRVPAIVLRRYIRAEVRRSNSEKHWTALLNSLVIHGGSPERYGASLNDEETMCRMRDLHYKLVGRFEPDEREYPLYESDGTKFMKPDGRLTPDQFLELYDLQWLLAPFCETARRLFPTLRTSNHRIDTAAHDLWRVLTRGGHSSVLDVLANYKIPAPHKNTGFYRILRKLDLVTREEMSLRYWYKRVERCYQLSTTMYWRLVKAHRLQDALNDLANRCVSNTVLSTSYKVHLVRFAEYNAQLFIDTHVRMFAIAESMRVWRDMQWFKDSQSGRVTDSHASALIIRHYPDCRYVLPCESEMPDLTPIVGLGNLRYEVNSKPPQPHVRQALLHIFSCKLMNHGWQLRNLPDILLRYMNGYMHRKSKTFVRGFPSIKEIVVLILRCGLLGNWVSSRTRLAFSKRVEIEFSFMNVIVQLKRGDTGTLDEALREGQSDTIDVMPRKRNAPIWLHSTHFKTWRPETSTQAHAVPNMTKRNGLGSQKLSSSRRVVPLIDTISQWMADQRFVVFYALREFYTHLDKTPIDYVLHDNLRWGRFKSVTRACMDRARHTLNVEGGAEMPQSIKEYWRRPLGWSEERVADYKNLWQHVTRTIRIYHEMSKNCFMKLRKGTFARISLKQMSTARNYIRSGALPKKFIEYVSKRANVFFRLDAGTEHDPVWEVIEEYDRAKANGGQRAKKPKAIDFIEDPRTAARAQRVLDAAENDEDEDEGDEDEDSVIGGRDQNGDSMAVPGREAVDQPRNSAGDLYNMDYLNIENEYDEDVRHDSNTTRYVGEDMIGVVDPEDPTAVSPLGDDSDGKDTHEDLPVANTVRAILNEVPEDDIDLDLMNMVAQDVARRRQSKMVVETHWLVELFGVDSDNLELFKRIYSYYETYDMPDNAMIRQYAQIFYKSERDFNIIRLYMALLAWHDNQAFFVLPREVRWRQLRALRRRWEIDDTMDLSPDFGWAYFSPSARTWMTASLATSSIPKLKANLYPDKDTRFFIKSLNLEDDTERQVRARHVKDVLQFREREASAAHSLNMLNVSHCLFTDRLFDRSGTAKERVLSPIPGVDTSAWGTVVHSDDLLTVYVDGDERQRAVLKSEHRNKYASCLSSPWRFDKDTKDAAGGSEVCAINLVGVVHYMRDRLYTLCVTCGVITPYTSVNMSNDGPTCATHDPKGRLRMNQSFLQKNAEAQPLAPADALAGRLMSQNERGKRESVATRMVVDRFYEHGTGFGNSEDSGLTSQGCTICKRQGKPQNAAAKQSMHPYRFRIKQNSHGRTTIETRLVCTAHATHCQRFLSGSFAGPSSDETTSRRNNGKHTDLEALFAQLQRESRKRMSKYMRTPYVASFKRSQETQFEEFGARRETEQSKNT